MSASGWTQKISQKKQLNHLQIALIGAARSLMGLPFEHPFDTIKTWMQSENQKTMKAITDIYHKKGARGFYAGFLVNCIRVSSKNAYRWPLTVHLIARFRKRCRELGWGIGIAGAAAGLITAIVESVILCPMERIKVWLMTSQSMTNYKDFWRRISLRNLFDGFSPFLAKQVLSWISFLGTQEYLKEFVYYWKQKDSKIYELTNGELILVSMLVCLVNTIFVMPADYIKTRFQRQNNEQVRVIRVTKYIGRCYRSFGLSCFYRGGGVKIVQYNINSLLTVPLMEKVLRMHEQ